MRNWPIILGLLLVLVIVFYTGGSKIIQASGGFLDIHENYQNYRPNRNSFRTYFRPNTFQGQRVDWKPSLPYYHLTPEYGAYARQQADDCLETGPVEL